MYPNGNLAHALIISHIVLLLSTMPVLIRIYLVEKSTEFKSLKL